MPARSAPTAEAVWTDGRLVPFVEATVHVLAGGLHYGTGVLEGTRVFDGALGPAVFRLGDHLARLRRSARMIRLELPYSEAELHAATLDTVRANGFRDCYLRHLAVVGFGPMGPSLNSEALTVSIAAWEWGAYLGEDAAERGIRLATSSWRRIDPNSLPPAAKSTANYLNSALAKRDALDAGFDEALLLAPDGAVSECSAANVFAVHGGVLRTPPPSAGALQGITQDTVLRIAADAGIEVRAEPLLRTDLYAADEAFVCGTASGIVPVAALDNREIGGAGAGPLTRKLRDVYEAAVTGRDARYRDWLTPLS